VWPVSKTTNQPTKAKERRREKTYF
jgi:hypothetical protein